MHTGWLCTPASGRWGGCTDRQLDQAIDPMRCKDIATDSVRLAKRLLPVQPLLMT